MELDYIQKSVFTGFLTAAQVFSCVLDFRTRHSLQFKVALEVLTGEQVLYETNRQAHKIRPC